MDTRTGNNMSEDVLKQLKKFEQIARRAVEERDKYKRQLQGLDNLTKLTKELEHDSRQQREKFKWVEMSLLRKEAELLRTSKKYKLKEVECQKLAELIEELKVKGFISYSEEIPSQDEACTGLQNVSAGHDGSNLITNGDKQENNVAMLFRTKTDDKPEVFKHAPSSSLIINDISGKESLTDLNVKDESFPHLNKAGKPLEPEVNNVLTDKLQRGSTSVKQSLNNSGAENQMPRTTYNTSPIRDVSDGDYDNGYAQTGRRQDPQEQGQLAGEDRIGDEPETALRYDKKVTDDGRSLKQVINDVSDGYHQDSFDVKTKDGTDINGKEGSPFQEAVVEDVSDGKSDKENSTKRKDKSYFNLLAPQNMRRNKMLAPSFEIGVSRDLYEQVLQQLCNVKMEFNKILKMNGVNLPEYANSEKFRIQLEKEKDLVAKKDNEIEELKKKLEESKNELEKSANIDKDRMMQELKEENEKLLKSDALKTIMIQATSRQYQEQKMKLNELLEQQRVQTQKKGDPLRRELAKKMPTDFQPHDTSDEEEEDTLPPESVKRLKYQRMSLKNELDKLTLEKSKLTREKAEVIKDRESLQVKYDRLWESFERRGVREEDVIKSRCQQCEKYVATIQKSQLQIKKLEMDVFTTAGQMKIFEEDYRRVERKIQVDEQNYKREIDGWMRNCQSLSHQLDIVQEQKQKIQDHTQALEYQLSIVQEYMRDHRPLYSVDSHPVARTYTDAVNNPGASLWQEGYRQEGYNQPEQNPHERYHPDRYGYQEGGYEGGYPAQGVVDFSDGAGKDSGVDSSSPSTSLDKDKKVEVLQRMPFQSSVDASQIGMSADDAAPSFRDTVSDQVILCCPGCGIMLPEDRQQEAQSHINSCLQ